MNRCHQVGASPPCRPPRNEASWNMTWATVVCGLPTTGRRLLRVATGGLITVLRSQCLRWSVAPVG